MSNTIPEFRELIEFCAKRFFIGKNSFEDWPKLLGNNGVLNFTKIKIFKHSRNSCIMFRVHSGVLFMRPRDALINPLDNVWRELCSIIAKFIMDKRTQAQFYRLHIAIKFAQLRF